MMNSRHIVVTTVWRVCSRMAKFPDGKQVVDPVTTLLQDMGAAPEIASEDEAQEDEDDVNLQCPH